MNEWQAIKTTKCCNAMVEDPAEDEIVDDNHPSLYGLANCPECGKCSEVETDFI